MPEDAEYVLQNTEGVDGFYGASSMERLPTEIAITEQIKKFKAIRFKKNRSNAKKQASPAQRG
jgi:predicted TIM-barrel enzyme